jgi:hypothetical protein
MLKNKTGEKAHLQPVISAKIEISPDDRTIRLQGHLGVIAAAMSSIDQIRPVIDALRTDDAPVIIDAADASLVPSDVQEWVAFVEEAMGDIALRYRASQLSEVLRYHEGYDHPNSEFESYGDEPVRVVNHIEFAIVSRRELSQTLSAQSRCKTNDDTDPVVLSLSRPRMAMSA